jgi:hypothetical protein
MPASPEPDKHFMSVVDDAEISPEKVEGKILASTKDEGAAEEPSKEPAPDKE